MSDLGSQMMRSRVSATRADLGSRMMKSRVSVYDKQFYYIFVLCLRFNGAAAICAPTQCSVLPSLPSSVTQAGLPARRSLLLGRYCKMPSSSPASNRPEATTERDLTRDPPIMSCDRAAMRHHHHRAPGGQGVGLTHPPRRPTGCGLKNLNLNFELEECQWGTPGEGEIGERPAPSPRCSPAAGAFTLPTTTMRQTLAWAP